MTEDVEEVSQRGIEKRWTPDLAQGGFTPIVNFFLEHYAELNPEMTSVEAMFVIQLMVFKWTAKSPNPGFNTISKRMGMSAVAARNHARSLEAKGCLKRIMRVGKTNEFDLTPLFKKLESHKRNLETGKSPYPKSRVSLARK